MAAKNYSRELSDAISTFLNDDDWNFSFDDSRGIFKFNLSIKGKLKKVNYIVDVKEKDFITYAISPLGGDTDDPRQMARLAEFVCRANFGLKNGCFEFDFSDGEIRYKSFVDCEDINPSTEVIKNSIYVSAVMMERYGNGIVDIIYGDADPAEAVEECER